MSTPKPAPKPPNVRIRCVQRVRYDQSIHLFEEELKGLKRDWNAVDGKPYDGKAEQRLRDRVDGIIDHADVEDGEDLDDIEIEFLKDE